MRYKNQKKLGIFIIIAALVAAVMAFAGIAQASPAPAGMLDAKAVPKFVNPLPIPGAYPADKITYPGTDYYEISMKQVQQDIGLGIPFLTTVWGYGSGATGWSWPAATIEAKKGTPVKVKWINDLRDAQGNALTEHLFSYAYDKTIHGAEAIYPEVRAVVHLHGGEVPPSSDGNPEAWYTADLNAPANGIGGPAGNFDIYDYPNDQEATTLWYHDHALGITRLNVLTGLAGFYMLRDPGSTVEAQLPSGRYEVPIVIQDRMFKADGSLFVPNVGENSYHPFWQPEFFGDTIIVNGKAWPTLNVEPRKYRIRLLNGSDARFYSLKFSGKGQGANGPDVTQIGSDGGFLAAPAALGNARLTIAPGERFDLIIDFSNCKPGDEFIWDNDAPAPFPNGTRPDPQTLGQIMQFKVVPLTAPDASIVPSVLNTIPALTHVKKRVLTLNEVMDMATGSPIMAVLNNTGFTDSSEFTDPARAPKVGDTELWEIVNLTGDAHPIHLHLIQFQLLNRQKFDLKKYDAAYNALFPGGVPYMLTNDPMHPVHLYGPPAGGNPDPAPYLMGAPVPAPANEAGWKDTVQMNPGEVTRILVRFAQQDGDPFSFDATDGNYVWHCHILEHEDNEMMLPYRLVEPVTP